MNRRYLTSCNILLAAVLFASIFLVNATTYIPVDPTHPGPDEIPPAKDYDPFADVNGNYSMGYPDGKIDIRDIAYVAAKFGTSGDSVRNVTVLNWQSGIPSYPSEGNETLRIVLLDLDYSPTISSGTGGPSTFSFPFEPKQTFVNITDMQIDVVVEQIDINTPVNHRFDIVFNDAVTIPSGEFWMDWKRSLTIHIEDPSAYQTIHRGINTLSITNVQAIIYSPPSYGSWKMYLYSVVLTIRYEYQTG